LVSEFAAAGTDIEARSQADVDVVYVYQGTAEQGPMFFDSLDDSAVAIADPDAILYNAFAVEHGGWRQMFGVRSWIAGLRATRKGHRINRKIGDPWTMPTIVAVRNGRIVGAFRGEHAGDHPDVRRLLTELETS